jgi:hypothetical protein
VFAVASTVMVGANTVADRSDPLGGAMHAVVPSMTQVPGFTAGGVVVLVAACVGFLAGASMASRSVPAPAVAASPTPTPAATWCCRDRMAATSAT